MCADLSSRATETTYKKLSNSRSLDKNMTHYPMLTNLAGRTKNFGDFKRNAYLPVFEAFVNSIHAIDDRKKILNESNYVGNIQVRVIRGKGQANATDGKVERKNRDIISFEIEDNGIGFNEVNFKSFRTSESDYKLSRGGKGIGRFSWLKAFEKAEIRSVYIGENNVKKQREFIFSLSGIEETSNQIINISESNNTIVKLKGFKSEYRNQESAWKRPKTIALRTLSHCLFYYIKKTAPKIELIDGDTFLLDELYDEMILDQKNEVIDISGYGFNIAHVKTRITYNDKNNIVLCASDREVESYSLEDYIGTNLLIDKDGDRFYYSVYVSSNYLDEFVNATRTSFDLPDAKNLTSFLENKIPINEIIKQVLQRTNLYLREQIEKVNDERHKVVDKFLLINPDLKYILHYYPDIYNEVSVDSTDNKLYELFYKYKGLLEYETKKKAEEFINLNTKTQKVTYKELRDKYERVTEDLTYVNSSDLAKYMIWRKLIIQAFEKKIQFIDDEGKNGKYETEYVIHDLIFPRKFTSDQLPYENINLWIIDENLEYHKIAVSDLESKKYSTSNGDSRADILVCYDGEDNKPATSIAIIEFKRPMRGSYDRDPVDQMYETIKEIRNKTLRADNGRFIKTNDSTRFYCYAICDITPQIDNFADSKDFSKLNDDIGYYGYSRKYNAYVEIMSFDELLSNVKKRHQRFFEKLGILPKI
jgi:hypothetical protein